MPPSGGHGDFDTPGTMATGYSGGGGDYGGGYDAAYDDEYPAQKPYPHPGTHMWIHNTATVQCLLYARSLHNFHFPSFSNYLMLNMTLPNVDCRILSRYIFKYLTDCDFWAISW